VARVYSTRFFAGAVTSITSVIYTVPAGYIAVIRDITATMFSTAAGDVLILGINPPGVYNVGFKTYGTNYQPAHWDGRMVLNPGDELLANTNATSANVVVSGYLLATP
jgi:hypothetical protein